MEMHQQRPILFSTLHLSLQLEILVEMESKDLETFQSCFPHYEDLVAPISTQKSYLEDISAQFLSLRNLMSADQTLMTASAGNPTIGSLINKVFQDLMVQPEVKYEPQDILSMTYLDVSSFYVSTVAVLEGRQDWVTRLLRRREMEILHQILDYMDPQETMFQALERMCRASPKHRLLPLFPSFFVVEGAAPEPEPGNSKKKKIKFTTNLKTTNEKILSERYMRLGLGETDEFRRRFFFYNEKEEVMRNVLEKMGLEETYSDFSLREERLRADHASVLSYIARVTMNGQNIIPAYLTMRISHVKSYYDKLRKEKWKADALESLILELNRRPSRPMRVSLEMPNARFEMPNARFEMPNPPSLSMSLMDQELSPMGGQEMQMHPSNEHFLGYFPDVYKPYIVGFEDVRADGHCGFRCIAASMSKDNWREVRVDLLVELNTNMNQYLFFMGASNLEETKSALSFFDEHAQPENWFDFQSMGYMVANKYNMAVIVLSNEESVTYLPMWSAPPENPSFTCIGRINRNHFIRVFLGDNPLLPPIDPRWEYNRDRDGIANQWSTLFNFVQV